MYSDCEKCQQLNDAAVYAHKSYHSCRPDFGQRKSKSRWPKAWRDESYRLELAANLARAKYEFHLGADHKNETYTNSLPRLLDIIVRKGKLKP